MAHVEAIDVDDWGELSVAQVHDILRRLQVGSAQIQNFRNRDEYLPWVHEDNQSRRDFDGEFASFSDELRALGARWLAFYNWAIVEVQRLAGEDGRADQMLIRDHDGFENTLDPAWAPHNQDNLTSVIDGLAQLVTQWNSLFVDGTHQSPPFLVFTAEIHQILVGQYERAVALIVNGGRGRGGPDPNIRHQHAPNDATANVIFDTGAGGEIRFLGNTDFHIDAQQLQQPANQARYDNVNQRHGLDDGAFTAHVLVTQGGAPVIQLA